MPVLHDLICGNEQCEHIERDQLSTHKGETCVRCGTGVMEPYYGNWGRPRNAAAIGDKDAVVVWEHPGTGAVSYPGRNDVPMPERYRREGYVRREMRSLREIDTFSKQHGLVNERAHYDSNGRGYDS